MKDSASTASKAGSFIVSESGHHGWIGVSEKDPHYLEYTDDTPFYGVGFCRPWNIYRKDDPNLFADMQKNGCNLFVLWLAKWDDMMLVNNTTGYDRYDMSSAAKLDTIFNDIETR